MKRSVIVDTGPLVAFLNQQDELHAWAAARFEELESPLLTCEAVISESGFLVQSVVGGPAAVAGLVWRGLLELPLRFGEEAMEIWDLMERYRNLPMSVADACLVRLAELRPESRIFTLDHHFTIYRKNRREALSLIIPESRR